MEDKTREGVVESLSEVKSERLLLSIPVLRFISWQFILLLRDWACKAAPGSIYFFLARKNLFYWKKFPLAKKFRQTTTKVQSLIYN